MSADVVWAIRGDDEAVADYIAGFVRHDRPCSMAVAGGRTPRTILGDLAKRKLPWNRVEIFPTDERMVPEGSDASNYRMIVEAISPCAAWVYGLTHRLQPPRFDLAWLGMGPDGKVASYFADTPIEIGAMPGVQHVRPDPLPRSAPYERLTLNISALLNANAVILVIRGRRKRLLVERALAGDTSLPIASFINAANEPLRIFWSP